MKGKEIRIISRALSQQALLGVLEDAGIFEQEGLEPSVEVIRETAIADKKLMDGQADIIFGSHISPYRHLNVGIPFVCLAQTVNYCTESIVANFEIDSVKDVEGHRMALAPLYDATGRVADHPRGNEQLILDRAGVDMSRVDVVDFPESYYRFYEAIADGKAECAFLRSRHRPVVEAMGLKVLKVEPLPMVNSITITAFWPFVLGNEDTIRRLIRSLARGIHYFKNNRLGTLEVLRNRVASKLALDDEEAIVALYESECRRNHEALFAKPDSIMNAFRLACMGDQELDSTINPMQLWDMSFVHELHRGGFYEELAKSETAS